MLVGSVALAALSLLVLPRGIAYDPWSWLIWGREILHGNLDTRLAATSVKPLAIALDTFFAIFGSAAPILWLVTARAAALLSLAIAFRLGCRLAGPGAGAVAAVGLAASNQYLAYLLVQGMSEPMAAAAVLAAVDCYLAGRKRWVLVCLLLAGWLRPEAWPFLLGYLLWLAWSGSWRRRLLAVAVGVAVPFSWFVIDWFGARQFFRSANAATHQSQGGPLLTRQPGIATIRETWHLLSGPVEVLFIAGFLASLVAWRRDRVASPSLWLSLAALGWLVVDAVLAQGRFATGAPRYLLPGDALACVVAGLFVADVCRAVARWGPRSRASVGVLVAVWLVLALCILPRGLTVGRQVHTGVGTGRLAGKLAAALPHAIALAGGRAEILRCGPLNVQRFQVPLVAWRLNVPVGSLGIIPTATGTVLQVGLSPRVPVDLRTVYTFRGVSGPAKERWTVLTACPPG